MFGTTVLTHAGGIGPDAFLVKLDNAGAFQWAQRFGAGGGDRVLGVDADAAGNIYITGHFEDNVLFGTTTLRDDGISDAFVVKLNGAGTVTWAKGLGGRAADIGTAIAVDDAGNVYTTGTMRGDIDLDPDPGGVERVQLLGIGARHVVRADHRGGAGAELRLAGKDQELVVGEGAAQVG